MTSRHSENITPTPRDCGDSYLIANHGGKSAAQDGASDGGEGAGLANQPTTAAESQTNSVQVLVQEFYGGRAPANVVPPEDWPRDELDDGPKTTEEPADRNTAMSDASPPGIRVDDDDDSTPVTNSTPTCGGPLHNLQQMEGLHDSEPRLLFVMRDTDATDNNFTFSETGKTQPS